MNTIKASVAGIAFTFERTAFEILEKYLYRINAGYKYVPDGAEIIADIEARIAELLLSEQEADKIVGNALVERIVEQLGYPDDLNPSPEEARSLPRRLYRNGEGAILGGVCSGLATYFGIDAVWLRLAVVLAVVAAPFSDGFTGFVTLAYFLLWLVVPMARTPRQKLEMTGAPITAERIEQQFRAEANSAYSNITSQKSASVWARLLYVLGRIFMVFVKVVIGFVVFGFMMAAIGIGIAIIAILAGEPYSPVLQGMSITSEAYIVLVLFAVLIPLILLIYSLGAALFNGKVRKAISLPIVILWVILLVYLSITTVRNREPLRNSLEQWEQNNFNNSYFELNDHTYNEAYFDYIEPADSLLSATPTDSLTINNTYNYENH